MRHVMSITGVLLTGCTAVLLCVTGNAAIHQRPGAGLPEWRAPLTAPGTPGAASMDDTLSRNGIAPGTEKARMLKTWFEMVLHDPIIATQVAGGAAALQRIFLDESRREALMSSGLARLTPDERLLYLQLFTRLIDELVPVNCFGLVDMSAVMNRITIAQMSDADTALYLRLLYRVLLSSASDASIPLPTLQEYKAAIEALSRAIVIELNADAASLDRYEMYTLRPSAATPSDVCWMTRVTLHAIAKMPESQRDVVLLTAITGSGVHALTSPAEVEPPQAPRPSRDRSTDKAIP